jgi:hypothetical protein
MVLTVIGGCLSEYEKRAATRTSRPIHNALNRIAKQTKSCPPTAEVIDFPHPYRTARQFNDSPLPRAMVVLVHAGTTRHMDCAYSSLFPKIDRMANHDHIESEQ